MTPETQSSLRPLKKLALNPATLRILDRPPDEGALAALPNTYFCTIACTAICDSRGCPPPEYTEQFFTCPVSL